MIQTSTNLLSLWTWRSYTALWLLDFLIPFRFVGNFSTFSRRISFSFYLCASNTLIIPVEGEIYITLNGRFLRTFNLYGWETHIWNSFSF